MKRARPLANVLVTGGAGFIGSAFIRSMFGDERFRGRIINLDILGYSSDLSGLADVARRYGSGSESQRYHFVHGDICDQSLLLRLFAEFSVDTVINFAAQTHVDRSLKDGAPFYRNNVLGTCTLLEASLESWWIAGTLEGGGCLFQQVSTDEVFGSLDPTAKPVDEYAPYNPGNPYAASKASADHFVSAAARSHSLPTTLSYCTNNYGPFQHEEKFIPAMVLGICRGAALPVYGNGLQIREWLHVDDHVSALREIVFSADAGSRWNISSGDGRRNLDVLRDIITFAAPRLGLDTRDAQAFVRHVVDRPGHDTRYALDSSAVRSRLGWSPRQDFASGLESTVDWYISRWKQSGFARHP